MGLVSTEDIYTALKLKRISFLGMPVALMLKHLLGLEKVNNIYNGGKHLETTEFLPYLVKRMNILHEIHEEDLKRIPPTGSFIIVSNHPLGGLDGILMMYLIRKERPDFKIMGNFLLKKIKPLDPIVFAVNPFETRKDVYSSTKGMIEAYRHVKGGCCLGIFPAGEVSFKDDDGAIKDREWQESIIKFIKKAKVPVVPMYFHAKNSAFFYRMAKISPDLQTAFLPSQVVKKKHNFIQVRVGKPISVKLQDEYEDIEAYSEFLRKKTYLLASFYSQKKYFIDNFINHTPFQKPIVPKEIIDEVDINLIERDLKELRETENALLFTNKVYECFLSDTESIPNILREIGRLREITFREVGEGTDNEIDLDRYDSHYHHLFLWDVHEKKIVGAYRMALGAAVFRKYGMGGFYTTELFNFEPEMDAFFSECIEMGRAFVVKEYQQRPLPLFLLWRGIVHVTLRDPKQKYIIGGVSISDKFSDFSKSLMIEFMKSHYYDPFIAQYVRPKNEYKVRLKDKDKEFIFDEAEADLNKFDRIIDELEPNLLRLPVLIKKYIKQNARVIGFNVDPKFNDAIDGLMYIRVSDIPKNTAKPVLEELQQELERKINQPTDHLKNENVS